MASFESQALIENDLDGLAPQGNFAGHTTASSLLPPTHCQPTNVRFHQSHETIGRLETVRLKAEAQCE